MLVSDQHNKPLIFCLMHLPFLEWWTKLELFLGGMRRDRFMPDLSSYATMLSAYVNASDLEGAERFFQRLKQDGLEANVVIYGTSMKGYAKVNDLEKMMSMYERICMQGIEGNHTFFTTIMDADSKDDFESAVVWFKGMSSRGFPPEQKAKNILLSLCQNSRRTEGS